MLPSDGFGAQVPCGPVVQRWNIIYPKPGEPLHVVITSHHWLGFDTHWIAAHGDFKGRTILCEKPDACVCQSEQLPDKWHGYIGVVGFSTHKPAVVSLTKKSLHSLLDLAGERETLRGLPVTFSRLNSHVNSPARALYLARDWPGPLPPVFDLVPSLEPLYGRAAIAAYLARHGLKDGAV